MLSPELGWGYAATPVHHASRRGRGMAARRTRAAAGEAPDYRVPGLGLTVDAGIPGCCLRTATARTWLGREPNRCNRVSLGGGPQRALQRAGHRVFRYQIA